MKSILVFLLFSAAIQMTAQAKTVRWTTGEARTWSQDGGWLVGANFIPKNAINQIEMWDKTTFDAQEIDRELALAEKTGLKTVRVFLHDLVWQDDPQGFVTRLNLFLEIADRHQIRPLLVFFDSCWNPHPHLGLQPNPTPGVHNSGWVQSPGVDALMDPMQVPRLKNYVTAVIQKFAQDQRILAWDLWNEPDNINDGSSNDPAYKRDAVLKLLPQVFQWARAANPSQPLTSGVWNGDWSSETSLRPIEKLQLELSDIISFHNYEPAAVFETKVRQLQRYDRPVMCTEYMARPLGSIVQTVLPIAKREHVNAFNWGFVAGKTQTYFPWDSWAHPYPDFPKVWFHDLFKEDGSPYDIEETDFIHAITESP